MGRVGTALSAASALWLGVALAAPPRDALVLEANRGQARATASFVARADRYAALLSPTDVELLLPAGPAAHLVFLDAGSAPLAGYDELPGRVHYLEGADPSRRIVDVPAFRGAARAELYPGVALAYRGDGRRLAVELTLMPGSDPAAIRLGLRATSAPTIDAATGELEGGTFLISVADGAATFVARGNDEIGLVPAPHPAEAPYVIRLVVRQSGPGARPPAAGPARVATGPDGSAFVAAPIASYPGLLGRAVVAKIAGDGATTLFTTYFGDDGAGTPLAIAVDRGGEAVLGGRGGAFVARLAADGTAFTAVDRLGRIADDEVLGTAIGPDRSTWIAGRAADRALLVRMAPDGSRVDASALLGPARAATAIAVDDAGNAHVAGSSSAGTPFVAVLDASGTTLRATAILPGGGDRTVTDLAVDRSGLVHVAGHSPAGRFAATLDGAAMRRDDPLGVGRSAAEGLALSRDGSAWLAGGAALAVRLGGDGRIIDRVDAPPETSATGVAPAGDGAAFLAGVSASDATPGYLPLATSTAGGTVFVGLVPTPPAGPDAAGCPGTIQFNNGAGTGLWQTAGNWNPARVPLSTDDVCIPAGFAVTLSSGPQSVNSLFVTSTSSLVVGASLSVAIASQCDGALTLQTGGTLTGAGSLTTTGSFGWTGGTMTGAGTTNANAGMAVSGTGFKDVTASRSLVVAGTMTWTGTGTIRVGSSGSITNNGTWDCQNDVSIQNIGTPGPLTNSLGSVFKKTAGAGTTTLSVPFNNAGSVSLTSGTLALSGGGTDSGSFTVPAGTTLDFGGGTHALAAGSSVNASSVIFDSGTVNIDGAYATSVGTTVSGATVNFNPASTLTSVGPALTISSGNLNLSSGEAVSISTLSFSGGALQGTDTVTISGTTTWSSGTMTGAGTTNANGGLTLSGTGIKDVTGSRSLVVPGTTTWTGTGSIRVGSSGSITNNGTWDCQSDATIQSLGTPGPFTNSLGSILKKSAGAGTTTLSVPFNNSGSVSLSTGTLTLGGGGTDSGSFTGSPGTTLDFNGGTHALGAASSVNIPSVIFDTGTVNIDGSYAATSATTVSGGTVNFNPASTLTSVGSSLTISSGTASFSSGETVAPSTLTLSGGTLQGTDTVTVSGTTTWSSGTMTGVGTTNANGGMTVSGTGIKDVTGSRVLNAAGTTTWTGTGSIRVGGSGSITNNGTWDCQSDATIVSLGTPGPFTNSLGAIFKKTVGTGTTSITVPFNSAGSVSLTTGTLSLGGGGTDSGSIAGSPGTTLRFAGLTHALVSGSSLNVPSVSFDVGTVNIDGSYAATSATTVSGATVNFNPASTLTSVGPSLTLSGGTANFSSGEAVSASTLTFSSGFLSGTDTVSISGLTTWSSGTMTGAATTNANGGIDFSGTGIRDVTGSRVLNVAGSTTWSGSGGIRMGSGGSITNNGTWDCQGSASIANLSLAGPFVNSATGTFKKTGTVGPTSIAPAFTNAGAVQALGSTLQFNGGYTQTAGSTTQDGGTVGSTTPLDIQGGTLRGTGTTGAPVNSKGTVSPGLSAAVFGIGGNYAQLAAGHFSVEISGTSPGTQHDRLDVTGTATLDGTLDVSFFGGYVPVAGDLFTILTATTRTGQFPTANLPPLGASLVWNVLYNPTTVQLKIVPLPSGRVPGDNPLEAPMTVAKSGTDITLAWGSGCLASDTDSEIYEGIVGDFTSHVPVVCSTGGATTWTLTPGAGNRYYLVVPTNGAGEGSYGLGVAGAQRPVSASACRIQSIASCP